MKTMTPEELGKVIRERRRGLKLSQRDLALTSGTGTRFIVDVEKGKPTCEIGKILNVIQELGLVIEIGTGNGVPIRHRMT
jgi:HTH-type transcriptional regulator/antitoxin HipB